MLEDKGSGTRRVPLPADARGGARSACDLRDERPGRRSREARSCCGADPLQHRQPARARARSAGVPRRPLAAAGFQCELLGAVPERPNLIARLRAGRTAQEGPTLCYLGHVDTVLADAGEWSHDPWSGDIADGFLWGRGALDMKSQVAAEIAAARVARALGLAPRARRAADRGGRRRGDRRLARRPMDHRDAPREGALRHADQRGRRRGVRVRRARAATASAAPRRACSASPSPPTAWPGHASMPRMGDNALLKMAPVLERLAARQPSCGRPRSRRRSCAGSARTRGTRRARSRACAPPTRAWRRCSSRCSASRSRRRGSALRRRST